MRSLPARLPVLVRPAHQETLASYVARLATLNTVTYPLLWRHLSVPDGRTTRRLIVLDRLAAATGRRVDDLRRAFLELRNPEPDWRRYRHLPQPGCPTCTGSHPGGTVHHLLLHHEYLCAQHGYWSGPPTYTEDMTPHRLSTLIPELTAAQREHDRLVRRHGWLAAFHAFDTSLTMCLEQRSTDTTSQHGDRWAQRLTTLIPPSSAGFSNSRFIAAFYPEIIQLTALFCSPRWQDVARLAMTSTQHLQAITAQINAVLGRPRDVPRPTPRADPLVDPDSDREHPHRPRPHLHPHPAQHFRRHPRHPGSAQPKTSRSSTPTHSSRRIRPPPPRPHLDAHPQRPPTHPKSARRPVTRHDDPNNRQDKVRTVGI